MGRPPESPRRSADSIVDMDTDPAEASLAAERTWPRHCGRTEGRLTISRTSDTKDTRRQRHPFTPAGASASSKSISWILLTLFLVAVGVGPSHQLALWPSEAQQPPPPAAVANASSPAPSPGSELRAAISGGFANPLEKCKNIRWDADFSHNPYPGMPPRYVPVCADLTPAQARRLAREEQREKQKRQTASPFSMKFTCTDTTDAICEKAKLGFEKAGKRLAQTLKIDKTIVVSATFKSFCRGQGQTCSLRNTLGQAQASSYLQGKFGNDGPWLFPQSLFKQINTGAQVQLKDVDIIAEFNTDFKFWFEGDGAIAPDQVDFELVVTHEFTHGLGMTSAWNTWFKDVYPIVSTQDFLTPSIYIQSPVGDTSYSNLYFAGWQQLQIFDKYLFAVSTNKSFVDSAKAITSFTGSPNTRLDAWVSQFQQSGDPYKEAQSLYGICTSGYRQLEFRIPSNAASKGGTKVFLQTLPNRWLPGSSIAHVDLQTYGAGPDFMMIPDVTSLTGRSLDNIIATQSVGWKYGAIGPQMAGMLSAMGWPTLISAADSNVTTNGTSGGVVTPVDPTNPVTPVSPTMIGPFNIPQFVGIVVGGVAVVAAITAAIIWGVKRNKRNKVPASSSAAGGSSGTGYLDSDYALSPYPAAPVQAAYTQAPRNAVAPAVYYQPDVVQPNGVVYFPVGPAAAAPIMAAGTPVVVPYQPPRPPVTSVAPGTTVDPYLADMPANAVERAARGVYASAAGISPGTPQEQSDAEYARTLQQQEELLAGVPLSAVAPVQQAARNAPPALPPRRTVTPVVAASVPTAAPGESDYELAKRLQEEEERASGIPFNSVVQSPQSSPSAARRPTPAGPRPLPPVPSPQYATATESGIDTTTYGSLQDRIRALSAAQQGAGTRPAGSYLDEN